MGLSGNALTDCLGELFKTDYPDLETLLMDNTSLSYNDVKSLSEAVQHGALPKLNRLNLSDNKLTKHIHTLLSVKYPSLKALQISNAELSNDDVKSLSTAAREGRLPKLYYLDLSDNILMNCLQDLFNDNHGFLQLMTLHLKRTQLNTTDIECLAEALQSKLPRLEVQSIAENSLS